MLWLISCDRHEGEVVITAQEAQHAELMLKTP